MQAALEAKTFVTSQRMLDWQYAQLLAELGHLQLHAGDPTCPCRLSKELGENCLAKHSLMVSSLAAETAAMDSSHFEMMMDLSADAKEKHEDMKAFLCDKKDEPEFLEWSRQWRKKIEPFYYHGSCRLRLAQETKTLDIPVHEQVITPQGERVLIIGAKEDTGKIKELAHQIGRAAMYEGDPLLRTIHAELCPGVIPCLLTDKKSKLPVCNAEEAKRLEHCILDVKESNREAGCKEGARASKRCPNPFAVCRTSIGCRFGPGKKGTAPVGVH